MKKWAQQVSGKAGGRWRQQHKTELDVDKWSVVCAPLGATRIKSIKSSKYLNNYRSVLEQPAYSNDCHS